jgi:aryl-alcohol dehydrogenase-like predicted oxidoreductase
MATFAMKQGGGLWQLVYSERQCRFLQGMETLRQLARSLPAPVQDRLRQLLALALRFVRPTVLSRREFLRRCAASAGGILVVGDVVRAAQNGEGVGTFSARDVVSLGPEKIETSLLAIGTGTTGWAGSSNQTRKMSVEEFARLVTHAYGEGVRFWDSADLYGSHRHFAAALESVPRDRVTILTKTMSRTAREVADDIERFRKELNTDYIDILLLHCLTEPNWTTTMREVMDVVSDAKSRGIIRTHGVSCHSFEALEAAAEEPWVEIDLARINPAGVSMDAPVDKVVPVLRRMHDAGKGVIGMKVYGAGKLVEHRADCLQYVLGLGCISAITLGIESQSELETAMREISALPRSGAVRG